jgi:hypothetical protein
MPHARRWALAFACLLLSPVSRAGEADAFLGRNRADLFDSYAADIRDGQHLSKESFARLQTSWEDEVARSRRRFLAAKSRVDLYYALLSLKNSVHDGHSRLTLPASIPKPEGVLRLPLYLAAVRQAGGKTSFVVTWSSLPGVEKGLVLERYGGKSVAQAMREYLEWLDTSSPEALEDDFAAWLTRRDLSRAPPHPGAVELVLRAEATGRKIRRRAVFAPEPAGPSKASREDPDYAGLTQAFTGLNYCVYSDTSTRTLILRFTSYWNLEKFRKEPPALSYALAPITDWNDEHSLAASLSNKDMDQLGRFLDQAGPGFDRLLVDVRLGSAYHPASRRFLELLADRPFKTTTNAMVFTPLMRRDTDFFEAAMHMTPLRRRELLRKELASGAAQSSLFTFYCTSPDCLPSEGDCRPSRPGRHLRLFVLSSPRCGSACDQFVSIVADNGLGTVVGLPSMGASSPFRGDRWFKLANGERFAVTLNAGLTYRANGEVLEGNPALPKIWVPPSPGRSYLRDVLRSL